MVSILTGATLLDLILRTSVALLAVGGLLIFISSQISSGMLAASLAEQEEGRQKATSEEEEKPVGEENENQSKVEA